MTESKFSQVKKGVVKRNQKRVLGLFIDGIGLDRAANRLARSVDIHALVKGVSAGLKPAVARYYTIIPNEDDARHLAYLDAVSKAGLDVIVKRLPPKGVNRQAHFDTEMASDIVAFGLGHNKFSSLGTLNQEGEEEVKDGDENTNAPEDAQRVITVVCPNKEMKYPLALIREYNISTVNADFGRGSKKDVLNSADKWIDLSDSESIWRKFD